MSYFNREFKVLSREQLERVHALTLDILRVKGVLFHSEVAREILAPCAARISRATSEWKLPVRSSRHTVRKWTERVSHSRPPLWIVAFRNARPVLCGVPVIHKKAFIREKGRRMYSSCRIMARSMCRSATVNAVMGPCRM